MQIMDTQAACFMKDAHNGQPAYTEIPDSVADLYDVGHDRNISRARHRFSALRSGEACNSCTCRRRCFGDTVFFRVLLMGVGSTLPICRDLKVFGQFEGRSIDSTFQPVVLEDGGYVAIGPSTTSRDIAADVAREIARETGGHTTDYPLYIQGFGPEQTLHRVTPT